MPGSASAPPELMPILSRGKHRNMRQGACFMEMASFLAGERWSDHPQCTHPLLAEVARLVNDRTSDHQRHGLAILIPSVLGLNGNDLRIDAWIALRCATTALPIASEERQKALAVGVVTADSVLAVTDARPVGSLEPISRDALDAAPRAAEWGRHFARQTGTSVQGFRQHAAPTTVRVAVRSIAEACVPDPDDVLRRLLTEVIEDCSALCDGGQVPARERAGAADGAGHPMRVG